MIQLDPFETLGSDNPSLAFLSSHRAVSVCAREIGRLADALADAAASFATANGHEAPTLRRMPDRCIVQLGPVALTVAWLRNGTDSPANGELLAIVWRGTIAPRGDHLPERLHGRPIAVPPVGVWEQSFVPSAASESTWHWHPESRDREGFASLELAAYCVHQLERALAA
ncbi:MAG: hypothetical protein MUD17_08220 [Gemmatimonadaceae bacterium]|nr:hypothetical protein [Gemmatimonadaceae bacterium]